MRRRITGILLIMLVMSLIYGVKYLYDLKTYRSTVSSLEVTDVDFSKISDGVYEGNFDVRFISAKTRITIKNGKIQNIELLKHKNGRGENAEAITQKVLSEQSLKVDTISGATNSSKVILKSIENAVKP